MAVTNTTLTIVRVEEGSKQRKVQVVKKQEEGGRGRWSELKLVKTGEESQMKKHTGQL